MKVVGVWPATFFLVGNWDDAKKNPETHFEVSGLFSEVPGGFEPP